MAYCRKTAMGHVNYNSHGCDISKFTVAVEFNNILSTLIQNSYCKSVLKLLRSVVITLRNFGEILTIY